MRLQHSPSLLLAPSRTTTPLRPQTISEPSLEWLPQTPTYTTGDQVLLSTDLSGNLRTTGTFTGTITGAVTGTLTNNNAAPSTNNLGVLPALANAADPTWNEGDLVTASVTLAGYQRVILHAETTKVIGVVRASDGAGNLLTSNSTTPAGHFALDSNITSILGTAPTTAGFLDVKGADGNVFVRQTTGTNLHVVTDSTSTTAVTQATASNLNAAVVGTKTNNNAAPGATNVGTLPAVANAAAQSWTKAIKLRCLWICPGISELWRQERQQQAQP